VQGSSRYLPENLDPHALNIVLQKLMGKEVELLELSGAAYHIIGFGMKAMMDGDHPSMYGTAEGLDDVDVIRGCIAAGEAKAALPIPWKFLIKIGVKVLERYLESLDG
jgi:hypothetical protein